jgi:formate-dependent phosphoribosylglycinamide formyltransferase (GAR transformylase)
MKLSSGVYLTPNAHIAHKSTTIEMFDADTAKQIVTNVKKK